MENQVLISVFVLFLGFSSILFSDAVPISRSLKSLRAEVAGKNLLSQGEIMKPGIKLSLIEGRKAIETTDYSDPGANKDHDPPCCE